MVIKRWLWLIGTILIFVPIVEAQDDTFRSAAERKYEAFRERAERKHQSFRDKANADYVKALRRAWKSYNGYLPEEIPDQTPLPPPTPSPVFVPEQMDYDTVFVLPAPKPQPKPIAPIPEIIDPAPDYLKFSFYGTECKVRSVNPASVTMSGISSSDVADVWEQFSQKEYNNLLLDCIRLRKDMALSDWAYFCLLKSLSESLFADTNKSRILHAYLFAQTGYAIRIGKDDKRLYLLVASSAVFMDRIFFKINDRCFYALEKDVPSRLLIEDAIFSNEKDMDVSISKEIKLSWRPSPKRNLSAKDFPEIKVELPLNENLMDFYNDYPRLYVYNSMKNEYIWRSYANVPMNTSVKEVLYPVLREAIKGKGEKEAVDRIINFVQTAFPYGYDSEIWGYDRPFFPEETLYYPKSDCEDRAILFSRLVRDLMGLDVVLLYLPGHLAAAVALNEDINGAYYLIDGRKYYYSEATCTSGAKVGWIPEDCKNVETIIVKLR